MATNKELMQIMAILTAAYPNAKIVEGDADFPGTVDVYAMLLADLNTQELLAAVKYCIATHPNFMPTIATLRDAVEKIRSAGAPVSGQDAWRTALREIQRCGLVRFDVGDHAPHFDDPAIEKAVHAIGWREICLAGETDPSTRAQFIAAYEAYARREKDARQLAVIPEARALIESVAQRLSLK